MNKPSQIGLLFLIAMAIAFVLTLLVFVNVISTLSAIVGLLLGYLISEVNDARNRRNAH